MSRSVTSKWTKWAPVLSVQSARFNGTKCRCFICGQKNANDNHIRNSYLRVGIAKDECGFGAESKIESRRLRRTRERNIFKQSIAKGLM